MTLPRARLIVNPVAGVDRGMETLERLNRRFRDRYGLLEVAVTADAGDSEQAARRAVEDGCDHLFVAGGDGTLNEALNGAASVEGSLSRVTIGIVPLGTGNDFARAVGIPADIDEAVDTLLAGRTVKVDVGRVNGRVFVNVSGGGFIAEVSDAVSPQLKSIAGRLAYLVGGAQALLDFEPVGTTLHANPGNERLVTRVYAFAVCNSRLIGGGRLIAPHAVIDDGLLDVCVIESMPTMEFITLLRQVAEGDHLADPRVHYLRASNAVFEFDRPVLVNTDGEVFETRRCEYTVLPKGATFFSGANAFVEE